MDFQTKVPPLLNEEALRLVSEQFHFFNKKLRNRVRIIYTTKQNQKDCSSPTFMLVFIHSSGSAAASRKRHRTRGGICSVDPGPAPSAISPKYEEMEGRFRFSVLFTELGTTLHIHVPSTARSVFPVALNVSKKGLTSLSGTSPTA